MTDAPDRFADTIIFPASLDPKAVTVVERLTEAGYESYLVGGCVRDLLLGHIPKDFDVSTEARPRQIRRVFRNCRVIGRRFKLAHVHFGSLVIEVATFRRNPEEGEDGSGNGEGDGDEAPSDDLLIVRDNVYGTSEEDARRRDFTMNALLFDVGRGEVIDWVGGFKDLQDRVLRTIGEPEVRLAEDPVRMLRAIKFTSRLSLTLDPALHAAMSTCAPLIERSAPPRVLEEIYKLLSCGKAEASLSMLLEFGLLHRLLPEVGPYWEQHPERLVALGRALDHVDQGKRNLSNALMLSLLYYDPWQEQLGKDGDTDPMAAARDLITPAALGMSLPRRDVGRLKALLTTQHRLESPRRGRRVRLNEFLARPSVQEAIDLLYLRCLAGGADPEIHAQWTEKLSRTLGDVDRPGVVAVAAERDDDDERPRRRRRRRGGRSRGRSGRGRDRERGEGRDDAPRGEGQGEGQGEDQAKAEGETSVDGDARGERQARSEGDAQGERPARAQRGRRRRSGRGGRDGDSAERGADHGAGDEKPSASEAPATPADDHAASVPAKQAPSDGAPQQAPSYAPRFSHTADDASSQPQRGIKGLMGRLVRKVLGQDDQPSEGPDAQTRARDEGAPATTPSRQARSTPRDAGEDSGAASARGASAPADAEPGQDGAAAEAGAASGTQNTGDRSESDGEERRPRRRRRRRRRSSGSREGRAKDGSETGDDDSPAESQSEGEGEAREQGADKTSRGGEQDGAGSDRPKKRRRRRRGSSAGRGEGSGARRGSGSDKGSDDRAASKDSEDGEGKRPSKRNSGGKSRSGGGRKGRSSRTRSNGEDRGRRGSSRHSDDGSGGNVEAAEKPAEKTGPGQRHPEDVEDIFDW